MATAGLWIKVSTTAPRHFKVIRLADTLGISVDEALGRLVRLWVYVLEFKGNSLLTRDDIVRGFCVEGDDVDMCIAALLYCPAGSSGGLIDCLDDGGLTDGTAYYAVHDWPEYSGVLANASYKSRVKKAVVSKKDNPQPASDCGAIRDNLSELTADVREKRSSTDKTTFKNRGPKFDPSFMRVVSEKYPLVGQALLRAQARMTGAT